MPSVESVGSLETTEPNDQLIARAKADIKDLLVTRNPDLPLNPEVERQVDTIIEIMVGIGVQKGVDMALLPAAPEQPRDTDFGFPT